MPELRIYIIQSHQQCFHVSKDVHCTQTLYIHHIRRKSYKSLVRQKEKLIIKLLRQKTKANGYQWKSCVMQQGYNGFYMY